MRKHIIIIDGIARVGEHYPQSAKHKETGEEYSVRDLELSGGLPVGIHTQPEAVAPWGDWMPIYPAIEEIVAKIGARASSGRVISSDDIPAERPDWLRDAWRDDGAKIRVDMTVARQNKLDRVIRPERNRRLAESDIEIAKLDGGGVAQALKAKRQALRDLPATIKAQLEVINDPAALVAFEPEWPI